MIHNLTDQTIILEDRDGEEVIIEPGIPDFDYETWIEPLDLAEFEDHSILIYKQWWGLMTPALNEIGERLNIEDGDVLVVPNWMRGSPDLQELKDRFNVIICVLDDENNLVVIK